jgi:hypothetical protein
MHSDTGRSNPHPTATRSRHRDRWPLPTAEERHRHEPADPGDRLKPNRRPLDEQERDLVGGFSRTSSMPWFSWSIPADRCRVGSRLWDIEGSVCHGCYARTRHYRQGNVVAAMERRFATLADLDRWAESMIDLLRQRAARFRPTVDDLWPAFRWHDSGDLQSPEHLHAICRIAEGTQDLLLADGSVSDIRYWLPTREYEVVYEVLRQRVVPRNLCIRVSAHMVDGPVPLGMGLPVSSVHTADTVYPDALVCPAFTHGGGCRDCRACWDPAVRHVSYRGH